MNRIRAGLLVVVSLASAAAGLSQPAAKPPSFDVASVKVNLSGANGGKIDRSGGHITIENTSLREIIFFAYGIAWGRDYQVSAPGWLDSAKFDILATLPPDTPRDLVPEMLKTLLAERFKLQTHNENRKLDSYALVIAKRGPKLQLATEGEDGAFIWGDDRLTARAISMAGLASRLSGPVFKLGRPVVDMTGIKGGYDFTLKWAPEVTPIEGSSDPSIFAALQEQLGLRLGARKVVFRILVIDHIDKDPGSN